jgi:hypothetical protein
MVIERLFFFHNQTPILYYRGQHKVTDDFDDSEFSFLEYTESVKEILDFVAVSIPHVEENITLFRGTYVTLTNGLLIPGKTIISKRNLELLLKENTFDNFSEIFVTFVKDLQREVKITIYQEYHNN